MKIEIPAQNDRVSTHRHSFSLVQRDFAQSFAYISTNVKLTTQHFHEDRGQSIECFEEQSWDLVFLPSFASLFLLFIIELLNIIPGRNTSDVL